MLLSVKKGGYDTANTHSKPIKSNGNDHRQ